MPLSHAKGLASYWFHDPEVLGIPGQIPMRTFLKFHMYIPSLRNKYSYLLLPKPCVFLIKITRNGAFETMENLLRELY